MKAIFKEKRGMSVTSLYYLKILKNPFSLNTDLMESQSKLIALICLGIKSQKLKKNVILREFVFKTTLSSLRQVYNQ